MNGGEAADWVEQLQTNVFSTALQNGTDPNFGTFANFIKDLEKAFSPIDSQGDAREELKELKMGKSTADEHVAKSKLILTRTGQDKTSDMVIDQFRDSLTVPLQRRIMNLDNPPTTLEKWYEWASKIDGNFRRTQKIIERSRNAMSNAGSGSQKRRRERRLILSHQRRTRTPWTLIP